MATDTPQDTPIDPVVDEAAEAAAAAALAEQNPVDETPLPAEPEQTDREKLLSGVDSVLKTPPAEATPAITDEKVAPDAAPAVGDKPADAAVEDPDRDDDKLEFKDHPRFKALREEAIAAREQRREYDAKLATASAELIPLTNLRGFLAESGVTGDEFSEGLRIMRALKNDPLLAAQLLEPHIKSINQFTGKGELPADLQSKVNDGEVSEEFAREVVRQRTEAAVAKQHAQRVVEQSTHADTQRAIADAQSAVMTWEQTKISSDPEYLRLQPLTVRLIQSAAANGAPRNAQEALNLANEAYAEATRLLPKAAPLPKPATKLAPSTASSSQARTVVKTKPKNLLDGVGQVLAGLSS